MKASRGRSMPQHLQAVGPSWNLSFGSLNPKVIVISYWILMFCFGFSEVWLSMKTSTLMCNEGTVEPRQEAKWRCKALKKVFLKTTLNPE